jgi:diacylglycerol kinase (ATP)
MGVAHGCIVVFNPMAGRRKAHDALRRTTSRLDGTIASVIETSLDASFAPRLRDAVLHARGDTGALPIVIAVGGDGTLSMAFNALAHPDDAALAVVPSGSGNDFAAALGLTDVDAAIDAIGRGSIRSVDFGVVNGRRFANCVGMGLDAEVGALAARLRKRGYPAAPSYYAAALIGLFMVKPVGVSVDANGAVLRVDRGVMVTVGNGHSYGGGFRGAPNASIDDGMLDVYVFSDIEGVFARMALMQRIRAGSHVGAPNVVSILTSSLVVDFDRDVAMHVDGEIMSVKRADVTLVPRGLRVVGPPAG